MAPRTRIRHKDIRLVVPIHPDIDRDEEAFATGRYFEADCLGTDLAGDFIYYTGDPVAGYYQVTKVDVTDPDTIPSPGVIIEKLSTTRCFVQTFGIMSATGLVAQKPYWIGADSQLSDAPPPRQAGLIVYAQVIGVAMSSTELLLRPQLMRHGWRG